MVRLGILDGPCDAYVTPQPFLTVLSKYNQSCENLNCDVKPNFKETIPDYWLLNDTVNSLLSPNDEQVLEHLSKMVFKLIWFLHGETKDQQGIRVLLDSMLEVLLTGKAGRAYLDHQRYDRQEDNDVMKVQLFLEDKPIPLEKWDRHELIQRLMVTWEQLAFSDEYSSLLRLNDIVYNTLGLLEEPLRSTSPLPHTQQSLLLHAQSPCYRLLSCLQDLFNQNRLLNHEKCPKVLMAAQEKEDILRSVEVSR